MSDDDRQFWARLTYGFPAPLEDGQTHTHELSLRIPLDVAWRLSDAIHRLESVELAIQLGMFAFAAARVDPSIDDPRPSDIHTQKITTAITFLASLLPQHWNTPRDRALEFTYQLLRRKFLTREEAARFASTVLGKHYSTDAWRLAVDRWAAQLGRPPVEIRRRQKK